VWTGLYSAEAKLKWARACAEICISSLKNEKKYEGQCLLGRSFPNGRRHPFPYPTPIRTWYSNSTPEG